MNHEKITLVGAGLAGSLLAVFLAKRGFAVEVYERRPDMRKEKIGAGRSINMAVSTRGLYALRQVGLEEPILQQAIPMKGRMVHALDGTLTFVPYGQDDREVIYSISRARLNMILMDEAEKFDEVTLHFSHKCTGMDFQSRELQIVDEISGQTSTLSAQRVLGTDGSASAVRMDMLKTRRFNFSQQYLEHGYKELTIPPDADGRFLLEKNALHIWPRGTYMLIALPNMDGSFTCTLFYPFEGEHSFATLNDKSKVLHFFEEQFPDAVALMPTLLQDFFSNPTGALVTIKCQPWHFEDSALLVGDAAHAIVPFYGQGMNCAFEDCTYLDECIDKHAGDWQKTFEEFERLRKANADAIAELALQNYIEMRDRVAHPDFLLQKQVGLALERKYPNRFVPQYSMVTFHRMPYSEAQSKGRIHERILDELCKNVETLEEVDWQKAEKWLKKENLI